MTTSEKRGAAAAAKPLFNFDPVNVLTDTKKLAAEVSELARGNFEAMSASTQIATTGAQEIGRTVTEMGTATLNKAANSLKGLTSARTPIELLQLQGELMKSLSEEMFADAAKLSNAILKLVADIAAPLSQRYVVAADKIMAATVR